MHPHKQLDATDPDGVELARYAYQSFEWHLKREWGATEHSASKLSAQRLQLGPKIPPYLGRLVDLFAESVASELLGFIPAGHGTHPKLQRSREGVGKHSSQVCPFPRKGWNP